MNVAAFKLTMAFGENELMVSCDHNSWMLLKATSDHPILFLHMGHHVVLLCFFFGKPDSQRGFSAAVLTTLSAVILICLPGFDSFPEQPAQSREASIVKAPQGFADCSWRPCWAWANGREGTTVWTFPTWDSVTWCALRVHPVIFLHVTVKMKGGPTCSYQDQKKTTTKKKQCDSHCSCSVPGSCLMGQNNDLHLLLYHTTFVFEMIWKAAK